MILFFTSTGNCQFVAQQLADRLHDKAVSILDTKSVALAPGEKLGFVFPTYFWGLPSLVDDYLKALTIRADDANPYIFFVATYGTTCGQTGTFVKRHLEAKGLSLSAAYSIKMADDWTVWFDLSNPEKLAKIHAAEGPQIDGILRSIAAGESGNHMKATLPMFAVSGARFFYQSARKTNHLHVDDSCIGCGKCAKGCPLSAIQMQNGKPVWVKNQCTMCLHCLHSCPKFAIQYDHATRKHGQYQHP